MIWPLMDAINGQWSGFPACLLTTCEYFLNLDIRAFNTKANW